MNASLGVIHASMIDKIAEAVLYEGYMLYPYRPSTKNRQRWTFGGVFPLGWCETAKSCDKSSIGTQCLVIGDGSARLGEATLFASHVTTSPPHTY